MSAGALLRVCDLHRAYGTGARRVEVLRGVDLALHAGQLLALRGPSGAGKTTLLNCIAGLDRPTTGHVYFAQCDITTLPERERVQLRRRDIGFIFQSQALLPIYSAAENIDLVLRLAGVPHRQRQQRVHDALEQVGLEKWAGHRPNELSGGQQQRVAIARVLAQRPRLILADEPTGELDTATAVEMLALLQHLAHQHATAVLIASHDATVARHAAIVYQLQEGRLSVQAPVPAQHPMAAAPP